MINSSRVPLNLTRRYISRISFCIMLYATATTAQAKEADCHVYISVTGEDRAMFNGYIYGYVSATIKGATATEINEITMRVTRETDKYCALAPADDPHKVIDTFTDIEAHVRRTRR